jgi:tryptophan synthase beta subunit
MMVRLPERDWQCIGKCLILAPLHGNLTGDNSPDAVPLCVGGGSNAMGTFHPYIGLRTRV